MLSVLTEKTGPYAKYWRIVKIGLIAYILSFVIGVAVGFMLGFNYEDADLGALPDSLWYIGMATTAMLTYFMTRLYFNNSTVAPSAREGLIFGVGVILVGVVLDSILFVPQIVSLGVSALIAYYTHPFFLLTIAILLAVATAVGILSDKERSEQKAS